MYYYIVCMDICCWKYIVEYCKWHLIEAYTAWCYDDGLEKEQRRVSHKMCDGQLSSGQLLRYRLRLRPSMGHLQKCKLGSTWAKKVVLTNEFGLYYFCSHKTKLQYVTYRYCRTSFTCIVFTLICVANRRKTFTFTTGIFNFMYLYISIFGVFGNFLVNVF